MGNIFPQHGARVNQAGCVRRAPGDVPLDRRSQRAGFGKEGEMGRDRGGGFV